MCAAPISSKVNTLNAKVSFSHPPKGSQFFLSSQIQIELHVCEDGGRE